MFLRVLAAPGPRATPTRVDFELDPRSAPSVRDVLLALSMDPDEATVDGRAVPPDTPALAAIADGALIIAAPGTSPAGPDLCSIAIVGGPDAGRVEPVGSVPAGVGRDHDEAVVIADPTVSRHHLEIDAVDREIAVRDVGSRNGTRADHEWVTARRVVRSHQLLHLGGSTLRITDRARTDTGVDTLCNGRIALVRPPRSRLRPAAGVAPPPAPHAAARRDALDLATIVVPIVLAAVMAVAFDPRFALMGLAGPVMSIVNHFARRRRSRRENARHERTRHAALSRFERDLVDAQAIHLQCLRETAPDLGEITARVQHDHSRLWERRTADDDFLVLSVGIGTVTWEPLSANDERTLADDARAKTDQHRIIDDAPIAVDARRSIGIRGDGPATLALARALVVQAAALHGPADLRIVVATTEARRDAWDFTEWLPHTFDAQAPGRLIAHDDAGLREVVERALTPVDGDDGHTWVVVDDASLVADRTMPLRQLLRASPRSSALVLGGARAPLPALCDTIIEVAHDMTVTVAEPTRSSTTTKSRGAGISRDTATRTAARLARFADAEAGTSTAPLPSTVSLRQLLCGPSGDVSIDDRWAASRASHSFVVPIGVDEEGPLTIDLVHDGPHLLVAGTTGSGKSELLRALITALAATVDTDRLNFLLVDYKGGSAFDRCGALPHTVGVVTDLDARLTARALTCLEAELRRREHALRAASVDDIRAYQRLANPGGDRLPRLVLVVDEFAALLSELPRFLDALVDIGQRGRSLGVHIVLATQRPSGVVNDALRANTNLRISLRVLDQSDSRDVIGVPAAAAISRHRPGRAIARMGAGELVTFQAATVSGRSSRATPPAVRIVEPSNGAGADDHETESDLASLVAAISDAHRRGGYASPRRPWPDPLPARITLDELDRLSPIATRPPDAAAVIASFGLADAPHEQTRVTASWHLAHGPLLVQSLHGGGATTTLTTIAIDVARRHPPDRVHLYVLDLGAGDLAHLIDLPHCGAYITATEGERQIRLLRWLSDELRERAQLGTDRRTMRPTIVVMVDNLAALSTSDADTARDALRRVVSDGAAVGVHLVASTDRAGALGHATDALIAQRVVLRLADPADYAMIGVRNVDATELPPGRGFAVPGSREIQVALPHADDVREEITRIARACGPRTAPPIAVLPVVIARRSMMVPAPTPGWIVGLLDRTLGPALLDLARGDHALIAGPPRSGKSNALAVIAAAASEAGSAVHLVAPPRSPLAHGRAPGAFVALDAIDRLVDSLLATDDKRGAAPHIVIVDDADAIDDGGHLERLLAARQPHVQLVVSARADRLRASYRHWTTEVRRSRTGVLLWPDDVDGELLGVRLPRNIGLARVAGRGCLIGDHGIEVVQLAHFDEHDGPWSVR